MSDGDARPGTRARASATLIVDRVVARGQSLDRAFTEELSDAFPERERAQIKALAFGALRWHHRHRLVIAAVLDRPLRARDRILESLLSVGLFELTERRQPDYAIISAAVNATRRLRRPRAAGLVNAALRRVQRERDPLLEPILATDEGRYSHPQWLIERVRTDWPDHWSAVLMAAQAQAPMWVRVNTARLTREACAAHLERELAVAADTVPGFPDALRLQRAVQAESLPGFARGAVSIQDAAAQLAAGLLAPVPGMRVLDACAAPGGKTGHLLERAGGQLDLTAIDNDAARNERVRATLDRLGFDARVLTADAVAPADWHDGRGYDRILVDAPCSATGVIRRHPDIKCLRRPTDIAALAARQAALLDALWPLLQPGGRLLYATCSLLREENQDVVAGFAARTPGARMIDWSGHAAARYATEPAGSGTGLQLLPGPADTDGFYYALMERAE